MKNRLWDWWKTKGKMIFQFCPQKKRRRMLTWIWIISKVGTPYVFSASLSISLAAQGSIQRKFCKGSLMEFLSFSIPFHSFVCLLLAHGKDRGVERNSCWQAANWQVGSCGFRGSDWTLGRKPARTQRETRKVTETTPGKKLKITIRKIKWKKSSPWLQKCCQREEHLKDKMVCVQKHGRMSSWLSP